MQLFIALHLPDFSSALFLEPCASTDILNVHYIELSLSLSHSIPSVQQICKSTEVMSPPHSSNTFYSSNTFKSYVTPQPVCFWCSHDKGMHSTKQVSRLGTTFTFSPQIKQAVILTAMCYVEFPVTGFLSNKKKYHRKTECRFSVLVETEALKHSNWKWSSLTVKC